MAAWPGTRKKNDRPYLGASYENSKKDVSFPAGNSGICNDKKVLIIGSKARGCNGCVEHDFNM